MKKFLAIAASSLLLIGAALCFSSCGCAHEWERVVVEEGSCTTMRVERDYCSKCESYGDEHEIEPTGHTGEGYVVIKYPVLRKSGEAGILCTTCGEHFNKDSMHSLDIFPNLYTYEDIDAHTRKYTYTLSEREETVTFTLPMDYQFEAVEEGSEIVGASVTGCLDTITEAVIPDTYLGYPVISISGGGFSHCTSITIPSSVTTFGEYAFKGCTLIEEFVIPSQVTSLGHGAFEGCTAMESIVIPDTVLTMDSYVFHRCTNLKNVTIGKGIQSLGQGAFALCSALEEIVIPDNITAIEYNTFGQCESLKKVTIGNGVETIGGEAFKYTSIKELILPDSVKTIRSRAFADFRTLSKLVIGSGVESIGSNIFLFNTYQEIYLYYKGTYQDWEGIEINETNPYLKEENLRYYSAEMPKDLLLPYWHFDSENKITDWTFESALDGTEHMYGHTEVTVSDEYWTLLKQMETESLLEGLFDNDQEQIEMVTSSTTKAQYEEKLEAYYDSMYSDYKVAFASGKAVVTKGSATVVNKDYVECDGEVYYVTNNQFADTPAFWVDAQTGSVYGSTELVLERASTIAKATVKHCYTLVQNG